VVAASPELYPDLLRSAALPVLLNLLNHENSDVVADVLELLAELTGEEAVEGAVGVGWFGG
jgi:beta-catenin-like protein 1